MADTEQLLKAGGSAAEDSTSGGSGKKIRAKEDLKQMHLVSLKHGNLLLWICLPL
jgi:hypothetical protein